MLSEILPQIYPLKQYNIVLANGDFPKEKYLIELLKNAKIIVCCDGAANKLLQHNLQPSYIIGDCDSISSEIKNRYNDKIVVRPEQSANDLAKALKFMQTTLSVEKIIILGATGSREDHMLGNIAILAEFAPLFIDMCIISDHGIFSAHNDTTEIQTIKGQQVSFFALNPDTIINCQELKWPLINFKMKNWHSGTLNQAIGSKIHLHITHTTLVYRAFEIKMCL